MKKPEFITFNFQISIMCKCSIGPWEAKEWNILPPPEYFDPDRTNVEKSCFACWLRTLFSPMSNLICMLLIVALHATRLANIIYIYIPSLSLNSPLFLLSFAEYYPFYILLPLKTTRDEKRKIEIDKLVLSKICSKLGFS